MTEPNYYQAFALERFAMSTFSDWDRPGRSFACVLAVVVLVVVVRWLVVAIGHAVLG